MPFPVTAREKWILAVVALLIVLGLVGMALLKRGRDTEGRLSSRPQFGGWKAAAPTSREKPRQASGRCIPFASAHV